MANLYDQLQGLLFTSTELRQLTDWDDRVIEDYLALVRNLQNIAQGVDVDTAQIAINTANIAVNAANIATNAANIAANAAAIAVLQRKVYGEFRLTPINGTATVFAAANTPVKAITGGNDVGVALNNVTKPVNNRLSVNEADVRDYKIEAVVSLYKPVGGVTDYRVHIYMDGSPLATPLFLDSKLQNIEKTFVLIGTAPSVSSGAHYFEVWVENLTNTNSVIWETGSLCVEARK